MEKQNRFVDQLAQSLLSGGDANDLLKKASAGEYDVKALLVNAVQLLPESKLRTGLRKNATFHVRKLLEIIKEAADEEPTPAPKRQKKVAAKKKTLELNFLLLDAVESAADLINDGTVDNEKAFEYMVSSGGDPTLVELCCEGVAASSEGKSKGKRSKGAAEQCRIGPTADICAIATVLNDAPEIAIQLRDAFIADIAAAVDSATADESVQTLQDHALGRRFLHCISLLSFTSVSSEAKGRKATESHMVLLAQYLLRWAAKVSLPVLEHAVVVTMLHLSDNPRGILELLTGEDMPLRGLARLCSLVTGEVLLSDSDTDGYRLMLALHSRLVTAKCKKPAAMLYQEILGIKVPEALAAWMKQDGKKASARDLLKMDEAVLDEVIQGYHEASQEDAEHADIAEKERVASGIQGGFFLDTAGKLTDEDRALIKQAGQLKAVVDGSSDEEEEDQVDEVNLEGLEEENSGSEEEGEDAKSEKKVSVKKSPKRSAQDSPPVRRSRRRE